MSRAAFLARRRRQAMTLRRPQRGLNPAHDFEVATHPSTQSMAGDAGKSETFITEEILAGNSGLVQNGRRSSEGHIGGLYQPIRLIGAQFVAGASCQFGGAAAQLRMAQNSA